MTILVNADAIIQDLQASKLDNNNNNQFKEAYNTGIDVAIGVLKRFKNIEGAANGK